MKKIACICMAVLLVLSALVGCSATKDNGTGPAVGKVVINFEGVVTAVDGGVLTLENGKTVLISQDTVFTGDPDTGSAVSSDIAVGNFIQGYTQDDPQASQVSAAKIYCNTPVQPVGGKLVVNFQGTVAAVVGNEITLDDGQVILICQDTVYSIPSGVVENIRLAEGYTIQE